MQSSILMAILSVLFYHSGFSSTAIAAMLIAALMMLLDVVINTIDLVTFSRKKAFIEDIIALEKKQREEKE